MKRIFTLCIFSIMTLGLINAQVLIDEDFESGALPMGWTQQTMATDGGFVIGTSAAVGSSSWTPADNGSIIAASNDDGCNCDKSADRLITPPLDFTGLTDIKMLFDINFAGGTYGGITETAGLVASLDGGGAWNSVTTFTGDGDIDWSPASVDLSALAGATNVLLAFEYSDGGGWLFGVAVDNVSIFSPAESDVELSDLDVSQYGKVNDAVTIGGTIASSGSQEINSFDAHWTDGTTTYTQNVTGVAINFGETYDFTHDDNFVIPDLNDFNIDVWVDNFNGMSIDDPADNMLSTSVSAVSFVPEKRTICEEATGTWCPWCPRGSVYLDRMTADFPETFIGIAVHGPNHPSQSSNGDDPMAVIEYNAGFNPMVPGWPSIFFDRIPTNLLPNNLAAYPNFVNNFNNYRGNIFPVDVQTSMEFDEVANEVTVTVTAEAVAPVTGNLRFNAVLTEDGITAPPGAADALWGQTNNYAGGGQGPMDGWENLPSTVPASQMIYDHVARAILGGYEGMQGNLPATMERGETYSMTFTRAIDAEWTPDNMHVVGWLADADQSNRILNAQQIKLSTTGLPEVFEHEAIDVFPNPFANSTNIRIQLDEAKDVSMQVMNALGEVVAERDYGSIQGDLILPFHSQNLADGIYYIHVRLGDKLATKKVTIAR